LYGGRLPSLTHSGLWSCAAVWKTRQFQLQENVLNGVRERTHTHTHTDRHTHPHTHTHTHTHARTLCHFGNKSWAHSSQGTNRTAVIMVINERVADKGRKATHLASDTQEFTFPSHTHTHTHTGIQKCEIAFAPAALEGRSLQSSDSGSLSSR